MLRIAALILLLLGAATQTGCEGVALITSGLRSDGYDYAPLQRGSYSGTLVLTVVNDNEGKQLDAVALRLDDPRSVRYPTQYLVLPLKNVPAAPAHAMPILVCNDPPIPLRPSLVKLGSRVTVRGGLMIAPLVVKGTKGGITHVGRDMPPDSPSWKDYLLLVRGISVHDK